MISVDMLMQNLQELAKITCMGDHKKAGYDEWGFEFGWPEEETNNC